MRILEWLRADAIFAMRSIGKAPAFAVTSVLTLALGIGASTAIFTVVHSVLLKPLAYPEPDRLVRVSGGATVARFEAISKARSYSGAGAFVVTTENVTLAGVDGPEPLKGARVSANFLAIIGVGLSHGRGFLDEDTGAGARVAIVSGELWQRRFGGDPGVVGGSITLGGAAHTIVGVLPVGFQFPFPGLDVWRPFQPDTLPVQTRLNSPMLSVFGRLAPGVEVEDASAELAAIDRAYALAYPGKLDAKPNAIRRVTRLRDELVRDVRSTLWMLFGAVGLVLLIACANVAGLLLARAAARSREFALRAALGAGRRRIVAQLLTESLLIALAGGALGVLAAAGSLRWIAAIPGMELPLADRIQMDGAVLGFALLLSLTTSVVFGLIPALGASRPDLAAMLKGSGGAQAGRRWLSPRSWLVVGQVSVAIVLLIGAALLIESLAQLRRVDPGFRSGNVLTMQIALPQSRLEELVQRVESVPGIRSAAVALTLPITGWAGTPVHAVGQPLLALNQRPIAILQLVTPGYFRTLGIPLRRGRDFTARDTAGAPLVAVINESLARRFWPAYPNGEDPVGHRILAGASAAPVEIAGVVADVRQSGLADAAELGLYRPRAQVPDLPAVFAVRTEGDPWRYVSAIRNQVVAIDRQQTITAVRTLDQVVDASEGKRRSVMWLLSLFASAGLALAVIGIYGLVAYSVEQRKREIGIRRALGAREADVLRLVLRQGLELAVVGAVAGIAGALALTRLLAGYLFQVSASDPATFAGIAALLVLAALAASWFPARRAVRIEPALAVRDVDY